MSVDYRVAARRAAEKYGVPADLFLAQIAQESGFDPTARSPAGAIGIAQIVPRWHPGVDPLDPLASLDYAAKHMSTLYKKYGNWKDPLSVYNSGRPYKVGQGIPETRNYVQKILGGRKPLAPVDVKAVPIAAGQTIKSTQSLDMSKIMPYLQKEQMDISQGVAPRLGDLLKAVMSAQTITPGAQGAISPGGLARVKMPGKGDTIRGGVGLTSTFGHSYQLPVLDKRFTVPGPVSMVKNPRGQTVAITTFDGKPVSAWMASVLSFARQHGWSGKLNSGYRSQAEQQVLWNRHPDPKWVARPGSSPHQYAQAVDVSDGKGLEAIIKRYKLPLGRYAPEGWHFEVRGFRTTDQGAKHFW